MVQQSDLPFRSLVEKYGATATYTQMLIPNRLLNDQEYLEFHLRDLQFLKPEREVPVVVQLGGNDPELVVRAGRKVEAYCDGIDLNLGCPQEHARNGHFGAYLLGQKDWPLVETIAKTVELALRLEAQGAGWITLHPRTVSARRRRQGAADLSVVRDLKARLNIPVVSNGNVRTFDDLQANMDYTGADGLMVGEALLDNPCLFANVTPDPFDISLEYLTLCDMCPGTALLPSIQAHIRHFMEARCTRESWFPKFKDSLNRTESIEEIMALVRNRGALDRIHGHVTEDVNPRQCDIEDEVLGLAFLH
ncbi:t-diRNAhydrouridine synthase [Coprinopsis marcescibilis]|uniref:tRNA-dihydrouridine(16/17) synthase [NAD(P)(+)] n=1 Tax=Coprinopsis marcescibilis TaxID=230819 RepID=A0A5C3KME8_COPMA|nr:t-diRNAhydrouridine synthase [Coprinopsis marcescibilis]